MFSPALPRHAARSTRTTRSRSLAMAAALALTLAGLGLAQPALAAGETASVEVATPAAGQSTTREIVLNATVDLPDGVATGGTALWSVKVGGVTKVVPAETFTVEAGATSVSLTPATITTPRGGVWLDWALTVTLDDGTVISDSGSQAVNDQDWGGAGGTTGCSVPPVVLELTKVSPDGSPLEGAGFSVSMPETPNRMQLEDGHFSAPLLYNVGEIAPVVADPALWPAQLAETPLTLADGVSETAIGFSKFEPQPCQLWVDGLAAGNGDFALLTETTVPDGYLPIDPVLLTLAGSASTTPLPTGMFELVLGSDFRVLENSDAAEITAQNWDAEAGVYRLEMTIVDQPIPVDPPVDPPVVIPPVDPPVEPPVVTPPVVTPPAVTPPIPTPGPVPPPVVPFVAE